MTYDEDNDIFISKKPYASWVLNVAEARWQSPIGDAPALTEEQEAQNNSGTETHNQLMLGITTWNESGQSWDLLMDLA